MNRLNVLNIFLLGVGAGILAAPYGHKATAPVAEKVRFEKVIFCPDSKQPPVGPYTAHMPRTSPDAYDILTMPTYGDKYKPKKSKRGRKSTRDKKADKNSRLSTSTYGVVAR